MSCKNGISVFLFALAIVSGSRPAAAADMQEWVVLKDGTVVQGDLVEYAPNDHVTVHLATGEVRRFEWSDIAEAKAASSGTLATSAPVAQTTAAPAATSTTKGMLLKPSKVGHWVVDMRIPLSVIITSPGPTINMPGFAIGVGNRVAHKVYLGVFIEASQAWNISDVTWQNNGSGISLLFREGIDFHYIFGKGTASVSYTGRYGPYYDTPAYYWLGGRIGGETTQSDVWLPKGLMVEADLGWDVRLGDSFLFGLILAGGVSIEPPGAYGAGIGMNQFGSVTGNVATARTNPYFTLGFHFALGG